MTRMTQSSCTTQAICWGSQWQAVPLAVFNLKFTASGKFNYRKAEAPSRCSASASGPGLLVQVLVNFEDSDSSTLASDYVKITAQKSAVNCY